MALGIAAICAVLPVAHPAAQAAGLNLSWGECGTAGQEAAMFACDGNDGQAFSLVASFVPPAGVTELLAFSASIDMTSAASSVPDWWRHGPGLCRGSMAMEVGFDFSGNVGACADGFLGLASGGFAYDIGNPSAQRTKLRVEGVLPLESRATLDPRTEYYAFRVNLSRTNTVGPGACAGCGTEMCIVLNEIQLFQTLDPPNDPVLTEHGDRQHVIWQSVKLADCPRGTPVRASTWGALKSLYR